METRYPIGKRKTMVDWCLIVFDQLCSGIHVSDSSAYYQRSVSEEPGVPEYEISLAMNVIDSFILDQHGVLSRKYQLMIVVEQN